MDSDNEIGPDRFPELWQRRQEYDFLIGGRKNRSGSQARKAITLVSKLVVRICYGAGVADVNSPYRLMRTSRFAPLFGRIPADTFAPNVIITGMAVREKMRVYETLVPFESRKTGKPSLFGLKLFKNAAKSFFQVIKFRFV